MYLGSLVEIGPADDVLREPEHPYTEYLLGAELPLDPTQNRRRRPSRARCASASVRRAVSSRPAVHSRSTSAKRRNRRWWRQRRATTRPASSLVPSITSPTPPSNAPDARHARRELVETRLGYLHVRLAGTGSPPLVLLHMSPLSGAMFEPIVDLLAASRLVVAPDRIGFGHSDRFAEPPTIADTRSPRSTASTRSESSGSTSSARTRAPSRPSSLRSATRRACAAPASSAWSSTTRPTGAHSASATFPLRSRSPTARTSTSTAGGGTGCACPSGTRPSSTTGYSTTSTPHPTSGSPTGRSSIIPTPSS